MIGNNMNYRKDDKGNKYSLPDDKTSAIEYEVQKKRKPKIRYILKMWVCMFCSIKAVSVIYLGFYIILSLLRPILAIIWANYISSLESIKGTGDIIRSITFITIYFLINYITSLIGRYIEQYEEIERLDLVQANRLEELFHSKIYQKLSVLSAEYFEIAEINDNINQVFSFVGNPRGGGANREILVRSCSIIAKIVSVFSIALSLYYFNPLLCFIAIASPLPAIYSITLSQKLRFRFIKDNTNILRRMEYFQQLMVSSAAKELKTYGLYDYFFDKWKNLSEEYTRKEKGLIFTRSILGLVNNLITGLANISGSVLAFILMSMGKITLGAFGAVYSLTGTLINDTGQLLSSISSFVMKKNEAAQFFDLMELPEQKNEGSTYNEINVLEARKLRYRYPLTEKYVLDGIDINITKGEKIALVGENGAGKSTFVKLICGLVAPSDGDLKVNGLSVESPNQINSFKTISVVMQDPAKYLGFTIGDNVFFGDVENIRDENIIDTALEYSGLGGVKKEELIGKDIGGIDISGGQWQKLAIARAIYRRRNFIILDEPTSNLDPIAEADLFKRYLAMSDGKTVVFVTHRISVASLADRILVFVNGHIVQDGRHEQLLREGGEYTRLYTEQAKWYNR